MPGRVLWSESDYSGTFDFCSSVKETGSLLWADWVAPPTQRLRHSARTLQCEARLFCPGRRHSDSQRERVMREIGLPDRMFQDDLKKKEDTL